MYLILDLAWSSDITVYDKKSSINGIRKKNKMFHRKREEIGKYISMSININDTILQGRTSI